MNATPGFLFARKGAGRLIMTGENDTMPLVIEKARLNLWNLIGFAAGIAVTAFGWGVMYNTMVTNDARAQDQITLTQLDLKEVKTQLSVIPQLQIETSRLREDGARRQAMIETNNNNVNARIDKVVDSLSGKIDTLVDSVNKVSTQVQVIATQIQKNERNSQ